MFKWEENIEYWKQYRENSMLSFNEWMRYAEGIQRPLIITDECKERFLHKSPVIWFVEDSTGVRPYKDINN